MLVNREWYLLVRLLVITLGVCAIGREVVGLLAP